MATPFACDRCLNVVVLSPTGAGEVSPMISLRMPFNQNNGMSEGLDFHVCADCYALIREFMGLERNQALIDGWKESREIKRSRTLPTLTYQAQLDGPVTRKTRTPNQP